MNKISPRFDVHKANQNIFCAKSYLSNVMKAIILKTSIATVFLIAAYSCMAQPEDEVTKYIEKYKSIALEEMQRSGIPASIKLGQAILESNAGRSALARKANNHFGIKCGSVWDGPIWHRKDDDRDRNGKLIKSCFRAYPSSLSSFIDHSEFLRDPRKRHRYGFLFDLNPKDYKKWARGLKKSGYATNPKYDKHLIALIEKHELYKFDDLAPDDLGDLIVLDEEEEDLDDAIILEEGDKPGSEYLYNNDVRYVLALQSESAYGVAARTGIPVDKIFSFNEQLRQNGGKLTTGQMVYLQPKRSSYRGAQRWHDVKAGEDMYMISQMYGLKLAKLYQRNAMNGGDEPRTGAKVKLRGGVQPGPPALRKKGQPGKDIGPTLAAEEADFEMDHAEASRETDFERPPTRTRPQREPANVILPSQLQTKPEYQPERPATASANQSKQFPEYYMVRKGDTLWSIARKFSITVSQIRNWNNLQSNEIQIGARLRVG